MKYDTFSIKSKATVQEDSFLSAMNISFTELTVKYDYRGERHTKERNIATFQEGMISIPSSATNIDVNARAVGGKTIFEKHYTVAMDHCYWVSGLSAWDNFYSERCP